MRGGPVRESRYPPVVPYQPGKKEQDGHSPSRFPGSPRWSPPRCPDHEGRGLHPDITRPSNPSIDLETGPFPSPAMTRQGMNSFMHLRRGQIAQARSGNIFHSDRGKDSRWIFRTDQTAFLRAFPTLLPRAPLHLYPLFVHQCVNLTFRTNFSADNVFCILAKVGPNYDS